MAKKRKRPTQSRQARGDGQQHQNLRAAIEKLVDAGEAFGFRCGRWIPPGSA